MCRADRGEPPVRTRAIGPIPPALAWPSPDLRGLSGGCRTDPPGAYCTTTQDRVSMVDKKSGRARYPDFYPAKDALRNRLTPACAGPAPQLLGDNFSRRRSPGNVAAPLHGRSQNPCLELIRRLLLPDREETGCDRALGPQGGYGQANRGEWDGLCTAAIAGG